MILRDGAKFIQTGDLLPNGYHLTQIGDPLSITDKGDLIWTGFWDDPAHDSGIFLNNQLLVQTNVTQINGKTFRLFDDDLAAGGPIQPYILSASDDGSRIVFGAVMADNSRAVVEINVPEPNLLIPLSILSLLWVRHARRKLGDIGPAADVRVGPVEEKLRGCASHGHVHSQSRISGDCSLQRAL